MKTHILQLEQHDDIISTRDKMGWAKSERILLVWPERGQVLNRRLDLALLQRHSSALGAQLALVTRDPDVRYFAPRLGIPVFKNLSKAQSSSNWRVPRRFRKSLESSRAETRRKEGPDTEHKPNLPTELRQARPDRQAPPLSAVTRVALFTLGVAAFLSIAAILFPSAEVRLTPETRLQDTTIEVIADPQVSEPSLAGIVPTSFITVTVEGRETIPVSGSIRLPDRPATGRVQFSNLTDQEVTIPKGSVVTSAGPKPVRFAVTQAGTISAGSGESLSLPIQALTPGNQGNLPAGSLTTIEGLLGTLVSVTNPLPTRNGTDRLEPAPTQEDRRRLHNQLLNSLEKTALDEAGGLLREGDLLVPSSLRLVRTLEETYQPGEEQPTDYLSLSLRLEFQCQVVSGEHLNALARAVLDAKKPPGFVPQNDTLDIQNQTIPMLRNDSTVSWLLHARRVLQADLPEPRAIQLALGLSPGAARERLETALPLKGPAQVIVVPAWWPRLPILPFRIQVRYMTADD